jgi:hypothetical protein
VDKLFTAILLIYPRYSIPESGQGFHAINKQSAGMDISPVFYPLTYPCGYPQIPIGLKNQQG